VAEHLGGVLYRSGLLWGILAAGTLLTVMGLLDDRFGLGWRMRLAIQFLVAIALVVAGVRGTIFVEQPWIGGTLTVFWIVVLINAFNFLDNMDALSSGIALIGSLMFASIMLLLWSEPRWLVGGCLLALAGSLAGFLFHNRPPARIFMGDSGSTFVGLLMGTLTVLGTFYDPAEGESRHVILAPLCILAIPLYDFCSVICIRLLEGRSPFAPDKKHFSHRLVDLGFSRPHAVLVIHLATLTTGVAALLLYKVADWTGALLVVAMVLSVLAIVGILETVGRRSVARERTLRDSVALKPGSATNPSSTAIHAASVEGGAREPEHQSASLP
jgi:UDP-GlcNAc:undecaprenyl-phosphate GlcNAc-1-phosphate transferase